MWDPEAYSDQFFSDTAFGYGFANVYSDDITVIGPNRSMHPDDVARILDELRDQNMQQDVNWLEWLRPRAPWIALGIAALELLTEPSQGPDEDGDGFADNSAPFDPVGAELRGYTANGNRVYAEADEHGFGRQVVVNARGEALGAFYVTDDGVQWVDRGMDGVYSIFGPGPASGNGSES